MSLYLDALTDLDCELIRCWRNHPDNRPGLRTVMPLTQQQQKDFYRETVSDRTSDHRYWAVREGVPGAVVVSDPHALRQALVGCVGLTNISWENGHAEISLIVGQPGQGHGSEAVRLVLAEAFQRLRLATVVGETYCCNERAITFWQRVAAEHRGTWTFLPRRKWHGGQLWDSLWFTIASPA